MYRWNDLLRVCRFSLFMTLVSGPLEARSILNFPFLTFQQDTITGVAIVNLGEEDAHLEVTAYVSGGQLLEGQGITNPVQLEVKAGTQSGTITVSLFGLGQELGEAAWFQAVSETDGLTGFFLYLDTTSSFLDGADLPSLSSQLVFSDVRVGEGERTELNLINPTGQAATAEVRLVSNQDSASRIVNLSSLGAARLDVEELFSDQASPAGVLTDAPVYVVVESDQELAGFEFVQPGTDLLGLNARPAAELLNGLFFPQLAVLGLFETELMVVSLAEEEPVILTITAYQPDGVPFGAAHVQTNPVTRVLEAGKVLREDLEQMFGFAGETTLDGWLRVESTSSAIHGAISYSIPALGSIASVASVASGTRSAVFSHIATTFEFFTGVAILNGGKLVANVKVVAVKQDGTLLGSFRTTLAPGQRLSRTLTEMIPAAADQAGGFILIKSDVPVYLTNVFGNLVSGVLSNVPPQPAPEEFEVETETEPIEVSPPLAIVPVAGMQQFEVMGPDGEATWSVNGEEGGGALQGTVDGAGRYTAPAQIPGALPVVVTARIGEDTAGASTDVLSREVLAGDLGIVQSVAYLSGLARVYTAELTLGAGPKKSVAGVSESSRIFDVTTGLPSQVAEFAGEDIPKMIPYVGSDGREYLLLAAKTTGRVIRLDPQTQGPATVVEGLDKPVSLVRDPVNGDLLVAERDKVTRVAANQLNQGLAGTVAGVARRPLGEVIEGLTPAGMAVDRCTGDIYVSDSARGEVRKVERLSGAEVTVSEDLADPGQLLGLYRSGISCVESFHLLITERGANRVLLLTSRIGPDEWVVSPGIRDLALKEVSDGPAPASLVPNDPGILLGGFAQEVGQVSLVPVDVYEGSAINPVAGNQLLTGIVGFSSNVRLLETPPAGVGDEDLTDPDRVHVFLESVTKLTEDVVPDTGELIPAGTTIRSYFFHYDPPGTAGGVLESGFVRFDDRILGVGFETESLDATDALLGSPATDYSGTVTRGGESAQGDFFEISDDQFRIDFGATATAGQDQIRVGVAWEGEVQEQEELAFTALEIGDNAEIPTAIIDVNDLGQVLGRRPGSVVLWLPEPAYNLPAGWNDLGEFEGDNGAFSINDLGQIVGGGEPGWIWQDGSFSSLSPFFPVDLMEPLDINNNSQITGGACFDQDCDFQAFRLTFPGQATRFAPPPDSFERSGGWAINDLGQVAGWAVGQEGIKAVAWLSGPDSGQVISDGQALWINDKGQVLMESGVLWEGGQSITVPGAVALNDLGWVATQRGGAALWINGTTFFLNDLIVNPSGVQQLNSVSALSDSGYVVANGGNKDYLLEPVDTVFN